MLGYDIQVYSSANPNFSNLALQSVSCQASQRPGTVYQYYRLTGSCGGFHSNVHFTWMNSNSGVRWGNGG